MMEGLLLRFRKYTERIDALSLRERGIVFVMIMVVLYAIAANFLFPPLYGEQDRLKKQIASKRSQIGAFETQIQEALAKAAVDPDAPNRARLAELQARIKALDESMAAVTSRLVSPKEMARVVEQILAKNRRLEVVRIESLPAAPLRPAETEPQAAAAKGPKAPEAGELLVYRHGMHVEFRGEYMDILRYLRALEELPWKVFWGQVTLRVEKYPVSRVSLRIYTLSTSKGWIGI